jgi:Family of unknown function (DUF6527)
VRVLKELWQWISEDPRPGPIDIRLPRFKAEFVEEIPDELALDRLYLVGENSHYWCAAMRCPCGCDASIQLSLVESDDPSWRFRIDRRKRPSLFPSVWRTVGCHSHFILRQGGIIWCGKRFVEQALAHRRSG